MPKNIYQTIAEKELTAKLNDIKCKGISELMRLTPTMAEDEITIEKLTKDYIFDVLSKKKSTLDLQNRYIQNLKYFCTFTGKTYIYDIKYEDGLKFQKYLEETTSQKNANNIIGRIRAVFQYAEDRNYIVKSPISALNNYKDR